MPKANDKVAISLVVPSYKQEKTITSDLKNINETLSSLKMNYEIIVVIDGDIDKTAQVLKRIKNEKMKVLSYVKNQGKGYAVKYGVMEAKGDLIGFIDAGMDISPSEISLMIDLMDWNKADIIIGSKLHPESKVNYPLVRKILSWGYRTFIHLLFGFSVRDTQVGLKIFRRKVAKAVFPKLLVKRFAFDVEALAVAHSLGYKKIFEAPIELDFRSNSSITSFNFWRIIFWMMLDTMAVFYRIRVLRFYDKNLDLIN
jgi:glycosyltransferase involved in cell wall biosynthesis